MEKHHLRQGVLQDCPLWLNKWICLVLHLLEKEYAYILDQELKTYE